MSDPTRIKWACPKCGAEPCELPLFERGEP